MPSYKTIVFMILVNISSPSAHDCSIRERISTRIVNGIEIKQGEYPFVVAIFRREAHICGGTIISPFYVVTAAHCVDEGETYSVLAGTVDLNEPGIRRKIDQIIVHPEYEYDYDGIEYDLAVVKLGDPLPIIRRRIMFVKLPKFSTEMFHEWGTVLGWGEEKNQLMGVELIQQDCDTKDHFFCLGHPDGDKDSCTGDSGGPFIIKKTLYGIVSHGTTPYCARGFPGVYVKVPLMVKWIKRTAKIRKCIMCPVNNDKINND